MKKIVTLTLALVLALSLADCGGGSDTPSKTDIQSEDYISSES